MTDQYWLRELAIGHDNINETQIANRLRAIANKIDDLEFNNQELLKSVYTHRCT